MSIQWRAAAEKDGQVGRTKGRGWGRAVVWIRGWRVRTAVGGYHDTKRGGTDVAFDFTDVLNGIRPHHVRVFVSVYHRPLCRSPAGPPCLSVCSSRAKPG